MVTAAVMIIVAQPAAAPNLRCLPDLVSGTPIFRDIRDFAADIPRSRFQEKPPLFIRPSLLHSRHRASVLW